MMAVCASGLVPLVFALAVWAEYFSIPFPSDVARIGFVLARATVFSSPLLLAVALGALVVYRRKRPLSPQRTVWTTLVFLLSTATGLVAVWVSLTMVLVTVTVAWGYRGEQPYPEAFSLLLVSLLSS